MHRIRDVDPDRPLRVGLMSGDLKNHPVAYFLAGLLAHHDRAALSLVCYSTLPGHDATSDQLRSYASGWRDVADMPDDAVAARIVEDEIDILIDLSGHTAGARLSVFALRPAPVTATWLGYVNTTGHPAIDYILTDPVSAPAGCEAAYSETIVRLPDTRLCYMPPNGGPPPGPTPAVQNGFVTFGSFNNLSKLHAEVLETWAAILQAVPGSRLRLQWYGLERPSERARLSELLRAAGIPLERTDLHGEEPLLIALSRYAEIDIMLDAWPFNGGTTSCQALMMGVPIVTLFGDTPASRQTAMFLHALGMDRFAQPTRTGYVETAIMAASSVERLAMSRLRLPEAFLRSPICDHRRFSAAFTAAMRLMWQQKSTATRDH
jgi:predicted O-linked N-acetylglucosamine transferase (SPINDLY family)